VGLVYGDKHWDRNCPVVTCLTLGAEGKTFGYCARAALSLAVFALVADACIQPFWKSLNAAKSVASIFFSCCLYGCGFVDGKIPPKRRWEYDWVLGALVL